MPHHDQRPSNGTDPLRGWLAAAGFFAAAAVAAAFAYTEMRAASASHAIEDAREDEAGDARRAGHLARAAADLGGGLTSGDMRELAATRALLLDPPDFDLAEDQTRRALRHSPARAEAWARLAYIDAARDQRLDEDGRTALAQSYRVEPFASEGLRRWRLEFALRRWPEIDEETRAAALREAGAAARSGPRWYEEGQWMWALAGRVPDGPGEELRNTLRAARGS